MSSSYRRDRYSSLVTVAAIIAVVVVAWISDPPNQQVANRHASAAEQYQEQRGPSEGYWWPEFAARDTYAQWAMTILALAATGVSIWAVRLVKHTLDATREVGRDQTRAYVTTTNTTLAKSDRFWTVVRVENTGQSPARWFEIAAKCELRPYDRSVVVEEIDWSDVGEFRRWNGLANGTSLTAPIIVDAQEVLKAAVATNQARVFLWGIVRYETIFGEQFESQFAFQGNPLLMQKAMAGETVELKRPICRLKTYEQVSGHRR